MEIARTFIFVFSHTDGCWAICSPPGFVRFRCRGLNRNRDRTFPRLCIYFSRLPLRSLQLHGYDTSSVPEAHLLVLRLFVSEAGYTAVDQAVWRIVRATLAEFEQRTLATPGGNPSALAEIPAYSLLLHHGNTLVALASASLHA
jgi:hypothetical protein